MWCVGIPFSQRTDRKGLCTLLHAKSSNACENRALDEAASPREGERFGRVVRDWRGLGVEGFWRVIRLGFRPLWLEFL